MKEKDLLELRRQVLHMMVGTVIVLLFLNDFLDLLSFFLLVLLGAFLSFVSKFVELPIVGNFIYFFERKKDKKTFPGRGIIFFGAGALLVLKLFSMDIALASIMILTFADSISNVVGTHFGKIKNPFDEKKKLEGNIAGFLIGSLIASTFVEPILAIFGSLIAMIFESVSIKVSEERVDDNLIVPLIAGTMMYILRIYFLS